MLGMYPGDPGAPGGDFAGVVARVPPNGSAGGIQAGDAVFGLAAGSLGSYVHASAKTGTVGHRCGEPHAQPPLTDVRIRRA